MTVADRREVTDAELLEHGWIVQAVLNRMRRRNQLVDGLERDDLEQVGMVALWQALQGWDPERGAFSTHSWPKVWGALMHHQRDVGKATGWHREHGRLATVLSYDVPLTADTGVTFGDRLEDPVDVVEQAHWRCELERVIGNARRLEGRERAIAGALLNDVPVAHLAGPLGVHQVHTSRIAKRVRAKLARPVRLRRAAA